MLGIGNIIIDGLYIFLFVSLKYGNAWFLLICVQNPPRLLNRHWPRDFLREWKKVTCIDRVVPVGDFLTEFPDICWLFYAFFLLHIGGGKIKIKCKMCGFCTHINKNHAFPYLCDTNKNNLLIRMQIQIYILISNKK
jgi:hypothetical protein